MHASGSGVRGGSFPRRQPGNALQLLLPYAFPSVHNHRKVEAVSEEAAFLGSSLERFSGREARRRREAADREELMAAAEMGRRLKNEMDEEAAVAGHMLRSRRMLSDMFEQGSGILANMAGSRERIKVRREVVFTVQKLLCHQQS